MNINRLLPLLSDLVIFVTVVDENSFSKASVKLGVAPSSVSRTITKLEHSLATKLLDRTTRSLKLTPTGQDVYQMSVKMMHAAQQAVDAATSQHKQVTGTISIAAPKAYAHQVLAPLLLDFGELHPQLNIELKAIDHIIDPISHDVDVLIHITRSPIEGLVSIVLAQVESVLCASPEFIQNQGVPSTPRSIHPEDCLSLGESIHDNIWRFENEQTSMTIQPQGRFAANHTEIRKQAVMRGLGFAIFPDFAVEREILSGQVIRVLDDWRIKGRYEGDVVAQYMQSKFVPYPIKQLIEYLKTALN